MTRVVSCAIVQNMIIKVHDIWRTAKIGTYICTCVQFFYTWNANWVLTNQNCALRACVWFFWFAFKHKFYATGPIVTYKKFVQYLHTCNQLSHHIKLLNRIKYSTVETSYKEIWLLKKNLGPNDLHLHVHVLYLVSFMEYFYWYIKIYNKQNFQFSL